MTKRSVLRVCVTAGTFIMLASSFAATTDGPSTSSPATGPAGASATSPTVAQGKPSPVPLNPLEWLARIRERQRVEQIRRNLDGIERAMAAYANASTTPFPVLNLSTEPADLSSTRPTTRPTSQPTSASTSRPSTQPANPPSQLRGISAQLIEGEGKDIYETAIKEIAATGANAVSFTILIAQEDGPSAQVTVAKESPTDKRLREIIGIARKAGLTVAVVPTVRLTAPSEGQWRATIDPTKGGHTWDGWWDSYSRFILKYARLCEESNVEVFFVGTAMISTESQKDRWVKLIGEVRKVYSGRLAYQVNWDCFRSVEFWDKLDLVSLSTGHDLCGQEQPTKDVLDRSWKRLRNDILDWHQKGRLPPLCIEAGYPSQITGAQMPWNFAGSDKPYAQLQKRCF